MSDLIQQLSERLRAQGKKVTFAESCTGGMLAAAITDLPGSSQIFDRGFITYSNQSKIEMLGVSEQTINAHGAVSTECAKEMAAGALKNSQAQIALSVTGIAGPDGGTAEKPLGLVHIALAHKTAQGATAVQSTENHFTGTRQEIRNKTLEQSLKMIIEHLESTK